MRRLPIYALLLAALAFGLGGCQILFGQTSPAGTKIAWNPQPGTNWQYKIWIGTNSGRYLTNYVFGSTNAWLPPGMLFVGTNFIAVSAAQMIGTNFSITTGISSEIQIVRIPPPAPMILTVSNALLTSSNLIAWQVMSNSVLTISLDGKAPSAFIRPNPAATMTIQKVPDTIKIMP